MPDEPLKLLPCPFCGHDSPDFERLGDRRQSCIVVCGMCGCRHESSDEGRWNGSSWNRRVKPLETKTTVHYGVQEKRKHDESATWARFVEYDTHKAAVEEMTHLRKLNPIAKDWDFRVVKITTEACNE